MNLTQTARETVIAALQAAGRPQLVAEIRTRIREDFGLDLPRDAIYTALVWLGDRKLVAYHEVPGSQSYEWRAIPAALRDTLPAPRNGQVRVGSEPGHQP